MEVLELDSEGIYLAEVDHHTSFTNAGLALQTSSSDILLRLGQVLGYFCYYTYRSNVS